MSQLQSRTHEPKVIFITHHPRVPLSKIIEIYEKVDPILMVEIERHPRNPNQQNIIITFEEGNNTTNQDIDDQEPVFMPNFRNIKTAGHLKEMLREPTTTLKCIFPENLDITKDEEGIFLNHFDSFGKINKHRIIYDKYGDPIIGYIQYQDKVDARTARFWSDPIYKATYCMRELESPFYESNSHMPHNQEIDPKTINHSSDVDNVPTTVNLEEKVNNHNEAVK